MEGRAKLKDSKKGKGRVRQNKRQTERIYTSRHEARSGQGKEAQKKGRSKNKLMGRSRKNKKDIKIQDKKKNMKMTKRTRYGGSQKMATSQKPLIYQRPAYLPTRGQLFPFPHFSMNTRFQTTYE